MSRFHQQKIRLKTLLEHSRWEAMLHDLLAEKHELQDSTMLEKELLGPLMGFLLHAGTMRFRASVAIGMVTASLAVKDMEAARVFMRRLMWHMNEESGNIGWGIPESMGAILARHKELAQEFHRILLSYILHTGKDDNYVDHTPLRHAAFCGVAMLAKGRPDVAHKALSSLFEGLADEDLQTRGYAAWAMKELCPLLSSKEQQQVVKACKALRSISASCEIFDGSNAVYKSVAELGIELENNCSA